MENSLKKLAIPSLLIGILITFAFTAQMTWNNEECSVFYGPNKEQTVECANMSYGYPSKFIQSSTGVVVSSPDNIMTESTIQLKASGLFWNLILWTFVSLVILSLISNSRAKKPPIKPKKAPKKKK